MATSTRPHKKVAVSTVLTLAGVGFSTAQISRATAVRVTPHDGDLVYLTNGQVPTATEGHIFRSEVTYDLSEDVANLQIVAQSGTINTTVELKTVE